MKSPAFIAIAVAVIGVAFLVLSLFLNNQPGWWVNVLIEVGATLLLFGVLVWLGRHVEKKLDAVQEAQHENQGRIVELTQDLTRIEDDVRRTHQELAAAIVSRVQADRQTDLDVFHRLGSEPSRTAVITALKKAAELNIPVPRLPIPNVKAHIQFRVDYRASEVANSESSVDTVLHTTVLSKDGKEQVVHLMTWKPGESTEDFLYRIARMLIDDGLYPGDKDLDLPRIFTNLGMMLSIGRLGRDTKQS